MNRILSVAAPLALALVAACGGRTAAFQLPAGMGGVRVQMHGTSAPGTTLGEIIIQNVFDPSQTLLQNCVAKPELLDGEAFCDAMNVLQPGVYEIKFESQTGCTMTQDHYKVVVNAGETTEVRIGLTCEATQGGLDVIVIEHVQPAVQDVSFSFEGTGAPANKYVCECGGDIHVEMQVKDSDTSCANLAASWSAVNGAGQDVTTQLLWDFQATPGDPCRFSARVSANLPVDVYQVTFSVTDHDTPATSLTVPIHLIDCGKICGSKLSIEKQVSPDNGITWFDADVLPGPSIPEGTNPQFKFILRNDGSTTLTLVSLLDDVLGLLFIGGTWMPGDAYELVFTGTWAAGPQRNTATFYGEDPDGNRVEAVDAANYVGRPIASNTSKMFLPCPPDLRPVALHRAP